MGEAEWQTRKKRIDTRLRDLPSPWQIIPWREDLDTSQLACHTVTEYPTDNGPADYALFVNGVLLGILEAKKVAVNPQNVLEQAKRYSSGATEGPGHWNGYRVPLLYATNGEIIWHLDVRGEKPASRQLADFHTGPAMAERFAYAAAPARHWLLDTPPETITRLRPYQIASIIATEQAILAGRRDLLVAMATGTGKKDWMNNHPKSPMLTQLMYGSDFYMNGLYPGYQSYAENWITAFHEEFPQNWTGLVGRNAAVFLGLHDGKQRERLNQFIKENGLTPRWTNLVA